MHACPFQISCLILLCKSNMRDRKERFVVLPFSIGCASQSSVAVATTEPCKKPKHETKSSHATRRQEGEESSCQEKTNSNTFSSLVLPKPHISSGMHKLVRGFKSLSHIFVYKEDDGDRMEREMEIGYPTDVMVGTPGPHHRLHEYMDGDGAGWPSLSRFGWGTKPMWAYFIVILFIPFGSAYCYLFI